MKYAEFGSLKNFNIFRKFLKQLKVCHVQFMHNDTYLILFVLERFFRL